jgi:acetolactate synthase-1/2/3 large subunit
MNGAQVLIKALENEGVDVLFGYPGGAIMPVYDALLGSKLRHILTRHEQGAALAADGYARASGKVGVCLATSGPGATNLVTGIANAYMDSVPLVAITGQVHQTLMGTDAFQEIDIFGITLPIVKHNFIVRDVRAIPKVINEAFELARSGKPGPVLIDFPKDVAVAEISDREIVQAFAEREEVALTETADMVEFEKAIALLENSSRPLLYVGGGVRISRSAKELRSFAERMGIPAVTTLQGMGAIPARHPLNIGMLGMHGLKAANTAVQECDLLICVGARFDDRATGKLSTFAPNAKVIHMDIDRAEVGKLRKPDASLVGDLKESLEICVDSHRYSSWRSRCLTHRKLYAWDYNAPTKSIYAPRFLRDLSKAADRDTYVACDVGQHQMWVAQHYSFHRPEQHLTSGGLGTMGFGLPAAIGAQFAFPEARVICVSGDGSIMMNIQELATINRYKLPIKIVLFDNQALGMVRQWQELFFSERYSEVDLSDNPDFVQVAESFGIPAFRIEKQDQVAGAIDKLLSVKGPLLCHVVIDPKENVWPLVPPGKSNSEMISAKVN